MEIVLGGLVAIAAGVVTTLLNAHREDRRLHRQERAANRVVVIDCAREVIHAADAVNEAVAWRVVGQDPVGPDDDLRVMSFRRFSTAVTDLRLLGAPELDEGVDDLWKEVTKLLQLGFRQSPRATAGELTAMSASLGDAKSEFLQRVHSRVGGITLD